MNDFKSVALNHILTSSSFICTIWSYTAADAGKSICLRCVAFIRTVPVD